MIPKKINYIWLGGKPKSNFANICLETWREKLQGYEIIVDPKCKGLIDELGLYRWKVDKYGNPLEIPEDKNNHRIDAIRYGSDDLYLAS